MASPERPDRPADQHADALFEAKYGFCRIDCDLCKRLDEETMARPDYDPMAAIESAFARAMIALADVGPVNEGESDD